MKNEVNEKVVGSCTEMKRNLVDEDSVKNRKPSRPYTDYDIFFQVEREYIIQVELGEKPNLDSGIFDPSSSNYEGPPLPSRYCKIVLRDDWYVPGNVVRRKRIHRKADGVIRFRELSDTIAKAWKAVDDETRDFCEKISDIAVMQYKAAMRKYRVSHPDEKSLATKIQKTEAQPKSTPKLKKSSASAPPQDSGDITGNGNFKRDTTVDLLDGLDEETFLAVMGVENHQGQVAPRPIVTPLPSFRSLFGRTGSGVDNVKCVDIEDEEILGMWASVPKLEQVSATSRSASSEIETTNSSVPRCCVFIPNEDPREHHAYTNESLLCQSPDDDNIESIPLGSYSQTGAPMYCSLLQNEPNQEREANATQSFLCQPANDYNAS